MLITVCFLAGCGIAPDAQPNLQQAERPCKPDTVYVEVGSSTWWGLLPEGEMSMSTPDDYPIADTSGALWYWHTENDTTVLPARVMRHAWPKPDTVVDIHTEYLYRDSTGRWNMIADSLAHELALMDGTLAKSRNMIFWFLGIVMALAASGMAFFHFKLKRHELGTE